MIRLPFCRAGVASAEIPWRENTATIWCAQGGSSVAK
jgi:hypothetical protein